MEISRDLFSFFLDKGIVTPAQGRAKGGVVRIDEDTAKTIEYMVNPIYFGDEED